MAAVLDGIYAGKIFFEAQPVVHLGCRQLPKYDQVVVEDCEHRRSFLSVGTFYVAQSFGVVGDSVVDSAHVTEKRADKGRCRMSSEYCLMTRRSICLLLPISLCFRPQRVFVESKSSLRPRGQTRVGLLISIGSAAAVDAAVAASAGAVAAVAALRQESHRAAAVASKRKFRMKMSAWLRQQCRCCFGLLGMELLEIVLAYLSDRLPDLETFAAVGRCTAHGVLVSAYGRSVKDKYEHDYLTAMAVVREMEEEEHQSERCYRQFLVHLDDIGCNIDSD